jgi:DNA-directed RNA polymerase-3 subunit RPC5
MERAGKTREPALSGRMQEARAVHMTVKSNIDGEEDSMDSMAKRITSAQSEAWKSHSYIDEDTEVAWTEYKESMFVGNERGGDIDDVLKTLPKLRSSLNNSEYLDTISAPRNTIKLPKKKAIKKEKVDKGKQIAVDGADGDEEGAGAVEVGQDTYSDLSDPPSDMDLD